MRNIKQANEDIREEAKKANVMQWRIAKSLGMTEARYYVLMREELPKEKKVEIRKIIAHLQEKEE